jgi:hypothetical protein
MISSVAVFSLLIFETLEKFMNNHLMIKPSKTLHSVGGIPFPSVSICPDPLVSDSVLDFLDEFDGNAPNDS